MKNNRYFAAYEVTKKALTPAGSSPSELNLSAIIIAGGTAGVAMWALAIPPDVRTVPFIYHSSPVVQDSNRSSNQESNLRQQERIRVFLIARVKQLLGMAFKHSGRVSDLLWHEYVFFMSTSVIGLTFRRQIVGFPR